MLQSAVITLREGLEAFLIVAISLAYLKKSGRVSLLPAVYWGVAVSVAVSVGAGLLLMRAANEALWEGILALVAAVLVATLTVHMWRAGKHMRTAPWSGFSSPPSWLSPGRDTATASTSPCSFR
jgi:high-affinity iron transporter